MNLTERLFKDKLLQHTHKAGTSVPSFGVSGIERNAGAPAASYLARHDKLPLRNACFLGVTWFLQLNETFSDLAVLHAKYFKSDTH